MDEDAGGAQPSDWQTGPMEGGVAAEMDTREAGASHPQAATLGGATKKEKQGKRGSRLSSQKKRKAARMEKAMAVAERRTTKVSKRGKAEQAKKSTKTLWLPDKSSKLM